MSIVNIAITCILYFCIMTVIAFTPVESAPKPEPVPVPEPVWVRVSNKTIITHLHQIEVRALT